MDNAKMHVRHLPGIGVKPKYKHHMLLELGAQLLRHGGPGRSACWHDESLNGALVPIARRAHRSVWASRVLSTWPTRAHKRQADPAW